MTDPYFLLKKQCTKCKTTKSRLAFNKRAALRDGLMSCCRDCAHAATADWRTRNPNHDAQYREANAQREYERQKAWRLANPDKHAARVKRWFDQHGDAYRKAHIEQRRAEARAYHRANPHIAVQKEARRRALQAGAYIEDVDRPTLWARDGGICYLCRTHADPTNWHLDHVIPLTRGGEHSYANTAVTHPSCNMSKGDRTPDEHWARLTILKWRADRRMERTAQTFGG